MEKITDKAFKDHAADNLLKHLGMSATEYLQPTALVSQLAEPYSPMNEQFYRSNESLLKYDPSFRFLTTTGDVYKLWRGLVDGKTVSAKSYALMTGEEEMKRNRS